MITVMLLFIACLHGTFGLNCQYNCSGNCLDEEPCNSTDGTCTYCSPGWDTLWCNKSKMNLTRLVLISIAKNKKKKTTQTYWIGDENATFLCMTKCSSFFFTHKKLDYSFNLNGRIMLL